jgi:PAS domain S-box-containing protein/putative nucleotidyltransferase with HDIG domain
MLDQKGQSLLENLRQLSLTLGTTLDLNHECAAFMQWLAQVIRPELAALFLADEKREQLELAGALGFKAAQARLALGLDPWQWLSRQGASLPPPGAPGRLALPLAAEGELLGLLALVSNGEGARKETETSLTEVAAAFFALHLRNIYRHRAVERLVEQRTAELRASEERFRRLAENAQDIIYRYELMPKRGFTYVSPAAAAVTGYTPEEHYADPDLGLKLVHPDDRPLLERYFRNKGAFGRPVVLRWVRRDGTVIWTEQRNVPIYDGAGTLVAIDGIARDITERKRAEEALQQSYAKLQRVLEGSVRSLAALTERRDPYTAGHQQRVAELACAIAGELGLTEDRSRGLRVAALLHDVGKIAVPAEILAKPTRLSELEFSMLKAHPQTGYEILSGIDFPWPVAEIVRQHHERLDGSGYPLGLRGEEILLEAQILAVADVVEAMASHRPYRPPHTIEKALEEIKRHRGIRYYPAAVETCIRLFASNKFTFHAVIKHE